MSADTTINKSNPQVDIDESLYSRQLYVLGKEAMLRMANSNVLIIGLKGLGVEIAKNVALAGVKSLVLHDDSKTVLSDLSTQFFLTENDIGKSRAKATAPKLAELNQYVPISVLDGDLTTDKLSNFQVIVVTEASLEQQIIINNFTHENNIGFISTDVKGLFGSIFVDLGESFTVVDQTGEEPQTGIVSDIDEEGIVTVLDETRHGLEDGDYVKFTEVEGISILNSGEPFKVSVSGPYTFSIGSLKGKGNYIKGGIFTQVKVPKTLKFRPLREELQDPTYLISDFAKFNRPPQLHLGFQALQQFKVKYERFPFPHNESESNEILHLVRNLSEQFPSILNDETIDEKLIKELSYQAQGDLPPMTAFFGGLAAQEVLKACSGKFGPIQQFFYFDSLESLPDDIIRTEETCAPIRSRYDSQIAVFGKEFHDKIRNLKVFLVGSGAIGCEMLKNWSLMGLGSGPNGKIIVTDNDSIEKSNLNRQFLFRSKDVGQQKSQVAAIAVATMNPDLKNKIEPRTEKVGPETEDIFDDQFWEGLDFTVNALDNVEARTYIDRKCVFYKKALLESGTLGTKGNTQVIIPDLTESYSSSQDPPEKGIPLCTLRSFPNKIDHTIAWAKSLFQGYFTDSPENANLYLTQPNYLETTLKQAGDQKATLESIKSYLIDDRPKNFEDCIAWARIEFEKKFNHDIQQLLYNFPKDAVTSTGTPFWSGPKRAPTPLIFDINNQNHFDFVVGGAHLRAFNYGIDTTNKDSLDVYKRVLKNLLIPSFSPKAGFKIQANENEPDPAAQIDFDHDEIETLIKSIPSSSRLTNYNLQPVDFEKDDDSNHHIEFINSASNCRALNYNIDTADKQKTKFIAGRIIPAIATTTALVTGLIGFELYKVVDNKKDIEAYKNGFVNLALPFFGFSEPIKSTDLKYNNKSFDKIWGRFELYGNITLRELIKHFKENEGLEVSMLSYDVSLLYASFFAMKKQKERLDLKLTDLVNLVAKKPIPAYQNTLILEICADDENDEDVEFLPYVVVHLKK